MKSLDKFEWISCDCDYCKSCCAKRPCWPTPEEAKALIDKGFGDRLMCDWWSGIDGDEDKHILCPAIVGHEGDNSPRVPQGPCTFFNGGLCDLHEGGLKPVEARISICDERGKTPKDLHERVAMTWNNQKAQKMVEAWLKKRNLEKPSGEVSMFEGVFGGLPLW